jgi:dihydrodipicolinate synthase/N-acetylneuraminate lyase
MAISDMRGIVCPMLTAFGSDGRIDKSAVRNLADFLLGHGVDALFPGGTNGEGMLLSLDERKELCETVVSHVQGRAPVIMHTGCIGTADTIVLTRHARDAGASAAAIVVPYYFTFDDRSLSQHFLSVARAVPDFPIFVYCIPGAAKNDVAPALLHTLHEQAPNIAGAKVTNGDIVRFQEYVAANGRDMLIFNGMDGLALPALAVGSRGQVSGNANVFPEVLSGIYRSFMAGDMDGARRGQQQLNHIRRVLSDGVHPGYLKAALRLRGVELGGVRSPMREPTKEEQRQLEQDMKEVMAAALATAA